MSEQGQSDDQRPASKHQQAAVIATAKTAPPVGCEDRWSLLMAQAQDGDDGAYQTLITELYPWLRRRFSRQFPRMLVEDAVQDVLTALHQKRHSFEAGRPFRRWLAAIARHKRIDHLRLHWRTRFDALPDSVPIDGHEASITSEVVIKTLLSRLKPAQADAIRLVRLQGYSVKETSAATGQSESLVKVNIHRGLGRFATMLTCDDLIDKTADAGMERRRSAHAASINIGCNHECATERASHRSLAGKAGGCGGFA